MGFSIYTQILNFFQKGPKIKTLLINAKMAMTIFLAHQRTPIVSLKKNWFHLEKW